MNRMTFVNLPVRDLAVARMYGHSFADPDGHAWEVWYTDPSQS